MENTYANIAENLSQKNGQTLTAIQELQKPLIVLKKRLKSHIESCTYLEHLDEIKDISDWLNELENRLYFARGSKGNIDTAQVFTSAGELELLSYEIKSLQKAVVTLFQSDTV